MNGEKGMNHVSGRAVRSERKQRPCRLCTDITRGDNGHVFRAQHARQARYIFNLRRNKDGKSGLSHETTIAVSKYASGAHTSEVALSL